MDNKYDITHITAENIIKYLSSIHPGQLIKFKQFARLTQLGATLRVTRWCIHTHAHLCPCDPFSCLPRISFYGQVSLQYVSPFSRGGMILVGRNMPDALRVIQYPQHISQSVRQVSVVHCC